MIARSVSAKGQTEGKLQMPLSPRRNGLDSFFKDARVFKVKPPGKEGKNAKKNKEILAIEKRTRKSNPPPAKKRNKEGQGCSAIEPDSPKTGNNAKGHGRLKSCNAS